MLARAEEMRRGVSVRILAREIGAMLRYELLEMGVGLSCCAEVLVLCCRALRQSVGASLYSFDQSLYSREFPTMPRQMPPTSQDR